jgi:hypothetical protein
MEASAPVSTVHLIHALQGLGGVERPTVDSWTWERLVLPDKVETELKALQATIEDPEQARRFRRRAPDRRAARRPAGHGAADHDAAPLVSWLVEALELTVAARL